MRTACVIGATGHVGSYMVPALVKEGYRVYAYSRSQKAPYTREDPAWSMVTRVAADRREAIKQIAAMHPDVICDLIAYTPEDMQMLCEALYADKANADVRLIFIGSVWVYEKKTEIPVHEGHEMTATDEYGRNKGIITKYLRKQYEEKGLRVTTIHPGHVCGRYWLPIGPQGSRVPEAFEPIFRGEEIMLPDYGQATLHHVHSEDIASLTLACLNNDISIGEEFHCVCETAITLYGLAKGLYEHYGHKPNIKYVPYQEFMDSLSGEILSEAHEHIDRSPCCSMEKARMMLGFKPKWSILDTVTEGLDYYRAN